MRPGLSLIGEEIHYRYRWIKGHWRIIRIVLLKYANPDKPQDGVVNKHGQTHDIKNLFVSDGSQFTTGAAENPTLTIVTLAIRQADYIAQEMGAKNI